MPLQNLLQAVILTPAFSCRPVNSWFIDKLVGTNLFPRISLERAYVTGKEVYNEVFRYA